MTDRVVAVIVTYRPDCQALATLLARVGQQVSATIVVDNTPERCPCATTSHAELIELGRNRGLAVAQNVGIRRAFERGADFVLLLDQDSLPNEAMVAHLVAAYRELTDRGIAVGAVGPRLVDASSGKAQPVVQAGRFRMRFAWFSSDVELLQTEFLVASGSLLPRVVLERIGLMDESLFIDQIDVEWELRVRAHGFQLYAVAPAVLTHRLGLGDQRIWCGRFHHVPVHAPWRNYYLFRNSVEIFFRRPAPLLWRVDRLKALVIMGFGYSTQVAPRWLRLRMITLGLWHALLGRRGELSA